MLLLTICRKVALLFLGRFKLPVFDLLFTELTLCRASNPLLITQQEFIRNISKAFS